MSGKKRGVKKGAVRGPYRKAEGIDVDKFLKPEALAASAAQLKADIRKLDAKLKAINALMRALKKENK